MELTFLEQTLKNAANAIMPYILQKGNLETSTVFENRMGQSTKKFDAVAEEMILTFIEKSGIPSDVLSEEQSGIVSFSSRKAEYLWLIDPVDGSTNFSFGIPGAGICISLIKNHEVLDGANVIAHADDVVVSFVGNITDRSYVIGTNPNVEKLDRPQILMSTPKTGMIRSDLMLPPSFDGYHLSTAQLQNVTNIHEAIIEIDRDYPRDDYMKSMRTWPLDNCGYTKQTRRNGAASVGLMSVATGAVAAYVDVRDNQEFQESLAVKMLVETLGGVYTDMEGNPFSRINLTDKVSYILSCGPELHEQLVYQISIGDRMYNEEGEMFETVYERCSK